MSFLGTIANSIKGALSLWGIELRPDGAADAAKSVQIMAVRGAPTNAPAGVGWAINVDATSYADLIYGYAPAVGSWQAYPSGDPIVDGSTWYTTDTLQGVADAVVAAIGGTSQGVRNYTGGYVATDNETLFASINALDGAFGAALSTLTTTSKLLVGAINEVDGHADAAQAQADLASEQIWPMAVLGAWAIDGDGARTNGAGLVGTTPTLTEAAVSQAKVENGGVFGDLSAVNAGYSSTYQLFPDAPVAETDYAYFGATVPFPELAFDMSATVATFDAAGVLTWEYWDGAQWSTLPIAHDGSSASTADGTLAFGRDGALSFVPPADWAQSTVDGVTIYWIRAGIAAGKAANLTQVPITNSKEHEIVTPTGGFVVRQTGTIDTIRLVDGAGTLHTTADVKFILHNYTTGAHSGELTFLQDQRCQVFAGLSLAVADGDVLGVVCTQEDTAAEPSGVILELGVSV